MVDDDSCQDDIDLLIILIRKKNYLVTVMVVVAGKEVVEVVRGGRYFSNEVKIGGSDELKLYIYHYSPKPLEFRKRGKRR